MPNSLKKISLIILSGLIYISAFAATPDIYQFPTQKQQTRFEYLTQQFRCLVCQNETLADSNAPLAQDLRSEISTLIKKNVSNEAITQYLVQRYGDFILFRPPFKGMTYLLWFGPFILLIGGLLLMLVFIQRRKQTIVAHRTFTAEQQQYLERVIQTIRREKSP